MIKEILEAHTQRILNSEDPQKAAREWLISTGIYNEDGSIHKDYGGE